MDSARRNIVIKGKRYKYITGDELVRKEGEDLVEEEINGSGYSAQLKRFIADRDKRLEEDEQAKRERKEKRTKKAPEPGDEE